jgi:putative transposase
VDYSTRWRLIKSEFTRGLRAEDCVGPRVTPSLWQARFWEPLVRDDEDFARHVDYIHFNPVKHGWVRRVRDWPWSSFHRFSRTGNLPLDWSGP